MKTQKRKLPKIGSYVARGYYSQAVMPATMHYGKYKNRKVSSWGHYSHAGMSLFSLLNMLSCAFFMCLLPVFPGSTHIHSITSKNPKKTKKT